MVSSTFGLGLLGANERKCGDAVIGGDASCTDQINVAFGWTCWLLSRAKTTEERKNNNKCIGKNNGSGLSCARAKDFARLILGELQGGRRADAMQKACFPDRSWTE